MRIVRLLVALLFCSSQLLAQSTAPEKKADTPPETPLKALPYIPSLDVSAMDRSVNPCVDFYKFSCAGWEKKNPIPGDQAAWSVYGKLNDDNFRFLWGILEDAAKPDPKRAKVEAQIGDFFSACMDESAIDKRGAAPLQPSLDAIAKMSSKEQIAGVLAREHMNGGAGMFNFFSEQDAKDSTQYIAAVYQGGLGLPDRDYYVKDDGKFPEIRAKYLEHVQKMFELLGDAPEKAKAGAETVTAIESALAKASLTRVERRDPYKNYHKLKVGELEQSAPSFGWQGYFAGSGLPGLKELNVQHPAFVAELENQIKSHSLDDWKTYLRWHAVRSQAQLLSKPFREENFNFYRRYLRGVQEPPPRWKTCVRRVDNDLGEALGQAYVARAFSPQLKADALEMVKRIQADMEVRLKDLDWMSPETKQQALTKLRTMVNKIGYPDKWRDYSSVRVERGDYFGNVERATLFENKRQLDRIGKPLDRGEWFMTPPTVNAYYNPQMNDINFSAGVLQPPLYDAKLDDAPNYGNTGATIGHELIHGFDDEGRQFDAQGNLKDWWTAEDDKKFRERAACVIDQYSQYVIVDDIKINGNLTAGEDIADLAGVILAWDAWKEKTRNAQLESRDGLTPEQRFFVGYAQWDCNNERDENKRVNAVTNPHSPGEYRINGVVVNMPEFGQAFACKAGDPMVKPADKVCKIW
ncbi:MAG TPA: M13 family metallopeptidase [Terriglobales bacterium]|nr:M13 family metallopeptidase [Terriglobales bacterium]